jgi:hypothetical protein
MVPQQSNWGGSAGDVSKPKYRDVMGLQMCCADVESGALPIEVGDGGGDDDDAGDDYDGERRMGENDDGGSGWISSDGVE